MGLINCSKNPLTEKLDALKDQLGGLLDDISSVGNSALSGLSDQLSQLEDGIKGATPELPELPDHTKNDGVSHRDREAVVFSADCRLRIPQSVL